MWIFQKNSIFFTICHLGFSRIQSIVPIMLDDTLSFWLIFGAILVFAELLLPGLVSIFIGLGAFTVAIFIHLNWVDNIFSELILWFSSSLIYIFTLRLWVMKFYPAERDKTNIDEDLLIIGSTVTVSATITGEKSGRIHQGDSTWIAVSNLGETLAVGEQVRIVGRENITLFVEAIPPKET